MHVVGQKSRAQVKIDFISLFLAVMLHCTCTGLDGGLQSATQFVAIFRMPFSQEEGTGICRLILHLHLLLHLLLLLSL